MPSFFTPIDHEQLVQSSAQQKKDILLQRAEEWLLQGAALFFTKGNTVKNDPETLKKDLLRKVKMAAYITNANGDVIHKSYKDAQKDREFFRQYVRPNYGLGIELRGSNLCAIDIDIGEHHALGQQGQASLERFCQDIGMTTNQLLHASYSQRTLTGGYHILFKMPETFQSVLRNEGRFDSKAFEAAYPGIEFRGVLSSHSISLAPTYCTDLGVRYEIINDVRPEPMPYQALKHLFKFFKNKEKPAEKPIHHDYHSDSGRDEALAAAILERLDPDMPRDDWIKVGTALKHLPSGLSLFENWSSQSSKQGSASQFKSEWASFRTNRANLGTLIAMGKSAGFDFKTFHREWMERNHPNNEDYKKKHPSISHHEIPLEAYTLEDQSIPYEKPVPTSQDIWNQLDPERLRFQCAELIRPSTVAIHKQREQAEFHLKTQINRFFEEAQISTEQATPSPHQAIECPTGLGKTHIARMAMQNTAQLPVIYLTPTDAQCDEWLQSWDNKETQPIHVYGRSPDASCPGHCPRFQEVKGLAQAGYSVQEHACRTCPLRRKTIKQYVAYQRACASEPLPHSTPIPAPDYACPYTAHMMEAKKSTQLIMTHESAASQSLFHFETRSGDVIPRVVVIDEDFIPTEAKLFRTDHLMVAIRSLIKEQEHDPDNTTEHPALIESLNELMQHWMKGCVHDDDPVDTDLQKKISQSLKAYRKWKSRERKHDSWVTLNEYGQEDTHQSFLWLEETARHQSLWMNTKGWTVQRIHPLMRLTKRHPILLMTATLPDVLSAWIQSMDGTIEKIHAFHNVHVTYDDTRYCGVTAWSAQEDRLSRERSMRLRVMRQLAKNQWAVLDHKKAVHDPILSEFYQKQGIQAGHWGADHRAHNRWSNCSSLLIFGVHTAPHDHRVRNQYIGTRMMLQKFGISWPEWNHQWDDQLRTSYHHEEPEVMQQPEYQQVVNWYQRQTVHEIVQAIGRLRATRKDQPCSVHLMGQWNPRWLHEYGIQSFRSLGVQINHYDEHASSSTIPPALARHHHAKDRFGHIYQAVFALVEKNKDQLITWAEQGRSTCYDAWVMTREKINTWLTEHGFEKVSAEQLRQTIHEVQNLLRSVDQDSPVEATQTLGQSWTRLMNWMQHSLKQSFQGLDAAESIDEIKSDESDEQHSGPSTITRITNWIQAFLKPFQHQIVSFPVLLDTEDDWWWPDDYST